MTKRREWIAVVLTLLLTSLLCLGQYHFDNKYTRNDIQPINGVLYFPEQTDSVYLIRQWQVYPDVLLTPETVKSYSGYRYYADIDGHHLEGTGAMTYRLTFILPDSPREYTIELPEIFSTCKVYLNDRLMMQFGTPEAEGYKEAITNKLLTFTGSGTMELLIACSDYSGINRGLIYPPQFGIYQAVTSVREGRQLLHGSFLLLALISTCLCLSFGLQHMTFQTLLTGSMGVCLAIVTGYPLYHGMVVATVQPWYTLEPLCYYTLLFLALFLQCVIYKLPLRSKMGLLAPSLFGLVLTTFRFGCVAILSEDAVRIFSVVSSILKYYTALGLLGLSFWAIYREKSHATLLLCGSVSLAICLVCDRLLPLYEPIYGGWFGEIGGIFLVTSYAAVLWLDAVDAYRFRLTYETSLYQMEQRLTMQKEHYKQLSAQVQLAREASHDLRHHMRTLSGFATQNRWDSLKHYLKEYDSHIADHEIKVWSDHPAADAILNYYASIAHDLEAEFDVRLTISPDLAFPDDELCILLSNLLENAVEALTVQEQSPRRIFLRGQDSDGNLGLVVTNSFSGALKEKNGMFLSTKHPGPGLGLSSIMTITKKHGGLADFHSEDGMFRASVLIPLNSVHANLSG